MINYDQKATDLHRKCIVVDMMNASMLPDEASEEAYIKKMIESGLTAVSMSVAFSENFRQTVEKIYKWYRFIEKYSDVLTLAKTPREITTAKKDGKIAILLSFQNTTSIENDLNLLYIFKQLGVSIMQITYNERNLAGDGCSERTNCGLSDFGVDMIKEMNRLGIAIDVAHVGQATTKDILEITRRPVLNTHTGAYAINPKLRNKTDDELVAIVGTGGMVSVLGLGTFLKKTPEHEITIEDFLDHMEHIVGVVGVGNVGFGLDLTENSKPTDYPIHKPAVSSGWPWFYPKGLESVSEIPNITKGLLSRKYSEVDIEKILGGNFLRVFEQIIK
jgi:membrane dipeptidase